MSSSSRSGGLNRLLMCSGGQIQTSANFRGPLNPLIFDPMKTNTFNHQHHLPHFTLKKKYCGNSATKKGCKLRLFFYQNPTSTNHWILAKLPRVIGQGARLLSPGAEALYLSWKCRGDVTYTICDVICHDMFAFKTYLVYIIYHIQCIYSLYIYIVYSHHLQQTCSALYAQNQEKIGLDD